jgi:hypothetical protein
VEYIAVQGKIIDECVKFQDAAGYDTLSIRFRDGSRLMVKEQGQAGYFSVSVAFPDPVTERVIGK